MVKVGNPPVNLLELRIREFRDLSEYMLGSGPTSEAPTILRDVRLDNWLKDDGRLPPLIATLDIDMLTTADVPEQVT